MRTHVRKYKNKILMIKIGKTKIPINMEVCIQSNTKISANSYVSQTCQVFFVNNFALCKYNSTKLLHT